MLIHYFKLFAFILINLHIVHNNLRKYKAFLSRGNELPRAAPDDVKTAHSDNWPRGWAAV